MSVAIAQVFGSALQGRSQDRKSLAETPIPLSAQLEVISVRDGEGFLQSIFEPLGYQIEAKRHPLDEQFPDWGNSHYFSLRISKTTLLSNLLAHLYVLIPIFDTMKHYYVGSDEIDKLLDKGEGWLAEHPLREEITRRYLKFRSSLYREALNRLIPEDSESADEETQMSLEPETTEPQAEESQTLHQQSLLTAVEVVLKSGAKRVLDLGCGEGKLLRLLLNENQFSEIVGMDVSVRTLEIAKNRLKLDRLPEGIAKRLTLLHGSLLYRDKRLEGFDAACVIEVIEHLDPPRLASFERMLFEFARPRWIVLTTPNREYNVHWDSLGSEKLRHSDHRFEWTRSEFETWARKIAEQYQYQVEFQGVGPVIENLGSPSQMGIFSLA